MDPVHRDIKLIIAEQYQNNPYIKALDKEIDLRLVELVSALARWIDDKYESLLYGGNIKEDVWCITIRVIISTFEYYLAPARDNTTRTYYESDPYCWNTLVGGVGFTVILIRRR